MRHPLDHGVAQPIPLDGGVATRIALVEQLAILDEQQRLHDERRHRVELGVRPLGKRDSDMGLPSQAENREAGLASSPYIWETARGR